MIYIINNNSFNNKKSINIPVSRHTHLSLDGALLNFKLSPTKSLLLGVRQAPPHSQISNKVQKQSNYTTRVSIEVSREVLTLLLVEAPQ